MQMWRDCGSFGMLNVALPGCALIVTQLHPATAAEIMFT